MKLAMPGMAVGLVIGRPRSPQRRKYGHPAEQRGAPGLRRRRRDCTARRGPRQSRAGTPCRVGAADGGHAIGIGSGPQTPRQKITVRIPHVARISQLPKMALNALSRRSGDLSAVARSAEVEPAKADNHSCTPEECSSWYRALLAHDRSVIEQLEKMRRRVLADPAADTRSPPRCCCASASRPTHARCLPRHGSH